MIEFAFPAKCRVLCLGAHSDDIEIGCGGTLLRLARECPDLELMWVVFSAEGSRKREAKASAKSFLGSAVQIRIRVESFRASYFPFQAEEIKGVFESLKPFQPDVVFTHYREDRHQDHRVVSDLTWNTFRNHLILEYEIPKYDGDLGAPNLFVRLQKELSREKARNVCTHFQTQANKHWFSEDTFLGLMRLRGMECASPTGYAEAFYCRKFVVGSPSR
jgi:LmbE family N-acetylglucosaminyl deacetylase